MVFYKRLLYQKKDHQINFYTSGTFRKTSATINFLDTMVKNILHTGSALFSRRQSNILSAAAVITIAGFVSSILGLVRNRILLTYFFEDPLLRQQLDAYWVAFRLPELIFQLLVIGALSAAFIPVFGKYIDKDKEEAYRVASSVMNLLLIVFVIIGVIIFIFAEQFNSGITSTNFSHEQVVLAANLTRIMLVAQFFFAISNFLTSIIQSQHRFLIPALSPLAYNIGIIGGIITLAPKLGIFAPAIGVVFGAFLHLAFQLPLAKRLGFKYYPTINVSHQGVKTIVKLMPPRTLTIAVNQIELFASVYLATALSAGSLTIFNIAQQLMNAPIRIFSVPIGQASLPFLSKETEKDNLDEFRLTLTASLHQILFLALPASVLLLVLRIPLVRLVYGAKEFPWSATLLTGKTVAVLSLSIFAQSAIHLMTRAFYALHNTKTPFILALIAVAVNIGLAVTGIFILGSGVVGLALAITIATILQALMLFLVLRRRINLSLVHFSRPVIKMLIATAITGISLWIPMRLLDQFVFDTTRTVPLIALTTIAILIGLTVYYMFSKLLRIEVVQTFVILFQKLGNWRTVLAQSEEVVEATSQTQEIKPL